MYRIQHHERLLRNHKVSTFLEVDMRNPLSTVFAFVFLIAAADQMRADNIPILSCPSCFSSSQVPAIATNGAISVDGLTSNQTIYLNSGPSNASVSASKTVATSDGTAMESYNADFNGIHFSIATDVTARTQGTAKFAGSITDYFFVAGASANSQLSLTEAYAFSGTTDPGSDNAFRPFIVSLDPYTQEIGYAPSTCPRNAYSTFNVPISGTCTATVNIPTNGILGLSAEVSSGVASLQQLYFGTSASVLAEDTVKISQIQVLDAQGNVEQGVKIYSASGTNYNAPLNSEPPTTSPVPEMPSIVLLLTGALPLTSVGIKRMFSRRKRCGSR